MIALLCAWVLIHVAALGQGDVRIGFPLQSAMEGVVLGNGSLGLMVYGDTSLKITVSVAGFWARQGGEPLPPSTSYAKVKQLVEGGNEAELKGLFTSATPGDPKPIKPFQMGGYELEFVFPGKHFKLTSAVVSTTQGRVSLYGMYDRKPRQVAELVVDPQTNTGYITFDKVLNAGELMTMLKAAYEFDGSLKQKGIPQPVIRVTSDSIYFEQRPGLKGSSLQSTVRRFGNKFCISAYVGPNHLPTPIYTAALSNAQAYYQNLFKKAYPLSGKSPNKTSKSSLDTQTQEYWSAFYRYGIYKVGACMGPRAPVMSLQGPFMEACKLPPWSNDYHFNVNVQMIYQALPALGLTHLQDTLWRWLRSNLPAMRQMGQQFFGHPKAVYLPHATDDSLHILSSFWTGSIDHGGLAWLGRMAYDYALAKKLTSTDPGNSTFLIKVVEPLLEGTLYGFRAMAVLEPDSTGKPRFGLPITVSPEFRGASFNAWGRNSNYALAACHSTAKLLNDTRRRMGKSNLPLADSILAYLPRYTSVFTPRYHDSPFQRSLKLGIWEGQDLPDSHRHHSHLAGLYPFRTLAVSDRQDSALLQATMQHIADLGQGHWAGWSYPWFAQLCLRMGKRDAAWLYLERFRLSYVNAGLQTTHNATAAFTSSYQTLPDQGPCAPIMQMDALFGTLQTLVELDQHSTHKNNP